MLSASLNKIFPSCFNFFFFILLLFFVLFCLFVCCFLGGFFFFFLLLLLFVCLFFLVFFTTTDFTTLTINIMYLINDDKKYWHFKLFNRRSHLSAFDHERHLVSWLRIK